MDAPLRIAEVARRSGFSAATLRYYEEIDLLPVPTRSPSGYRAYDEAVLDRLAFIARAKALGCSLTEVADLLPRWDSGRCGPVQEQLRDLVETKLGDARARITELTALIQDLRQVHHTLGAHTPYGPCDAACGCIAETAAPIVCTLEEDRLPGRLRDWEDLLGHVDDRELIDGGVRLHLDATTPIDELARLVAAEQACCRFFGFSITVDGHGVGLEMTAPPDGQHVIATLFGGHAG